MPYTKAEDRARIYQLGLAGVKGPGDLNLFLTLQILIVFKENPSYATIHALRRDLVIAPKKSALLQGIRAAFKRSNVPVDWDNLMAAAAEAFHEFRERVGKLYEALKCQENGDLPEYEEIIGSLLQKIGEIKKQKDATKLVLPNEVKQ